MTSTENDSIDDGRIHAETPAEGDTHADPTDQRVHAEAPAEGADPEGEDGSAG